MLEKCGEDMRGGGGEGISQSASCGDLLLQQLFVSDSQWSAASVVAVAGAASEKTVAV
jgi:hypothetical protein